MQINGLYSTLASSVSEKDMKILESIFENYTEEEIYEAVKDIINEDGNWHQTGGSIEKGAKGALRSIPSLAITAICWPVAALSLIGALSHRMQQKWEDKKSWLNRLNPRYWTEYIGTPDKDKPKEYYDSDEKKKSDDYDEYDSSTSASNTDYDYKETMTPEEVKNIVFRKFWVELSNGEVLRLRGDSKESIKEGLDAFVKAIRPTYVKLQNRINAGSPKYIFVFDDGEIVHWAKSYSNQSDKEMKEEVTDTRNELTDEQNKTYPNLMKLTKLNSPKIVRKIKKSGENIVFPEVGKYKIMDESEYKSVILPKPKDVPKDIYALPRAKQYKAVINNIALLIPAEDEITVEKIVKDVIENSGFKRAYSNYHTASKKYAIVMGDGDRYIIPAESEPEARNIAKAIMDVKLKSIRGKLEWFQAAKDDFVDIVDEYGDLIRSIKDISLVDESKKTYKPDVSEMKIAQKLDDKTYGKPVIRRAA